MKIVRTNGCEEAVDEIVPTGPAEIIMIVAIVAVVAAAGIYFWQSGKKLKTVVNSTSSSSKTDVEDESADEDAHDL